MTRLIILLIAGLIVSSCSQHGCPGGMCPPDHYNAKSKKANKRSLNSSRNSMMSYRSLNKGKRSKNDWSRSSTGSNSKFKKNFESDKFAGSTKRGFGFKKNFESDKYAGTSNKGGLFKSNIESDRRAGRRESRKNRSYSLMEQNPFTEKRTHIFNSNKMLGAKKIKDKRRNGHEEGLFSAKESRYQNTNSRFLNRKRKQSEKEKVGVKKMD